MDLGATSRTVEPAVDAVTARERGRVALGVAVAAVLATLIVATGFAARANADNGSPPPQVSQALEDGDGADPGMSADRAEPEVADAAPPPSASFVDDYSRLWNAVERGRLRVVSLKGDLVAARWSAKWAARDGLLALRERNEAEYQLNVAEVQYETAVRSLYISGSTSLDLVMNVLGSQPEDVLRNIDALAYLKSATGAEIVDVDGARQHATRGQSLAAAAQIQVAQARQRSRAVGTDLKRAKAALAADQAQLAALTTSAVVQSDVDESGCPLSALDGSVPAGTDVRELCARAVKKAPSPQAAVAIKWALSRLGAPYACGGVGRLEPWRFDCSSYVARAYAEGAGIGTAGTGWAPSTRNMVPWDGAALDPHYAPINPGDLQPGDLVLYDTCPAGEVCTYRHVAMYLGPATAGGPPLVAQTNQCGSVAHVALFPGTEVANFLGVRRVVAIAGESVNLSGGVATGSTESTAQERASG